MEITVGHVITIAVALLTGFAWLLRLESTVKGVDTMANKTEKRLDTHIADKNEHYNREALAIEMRHLQSAMVEVRTEMQAATVNLNNSMAGVNKFMGEMQAAVNSLRKEQR